MVKIFNKTILLFLFFMTCGCHPPGPMLVKNQSITLDDAQSVRVDIWMDEGSLKIQGGAPSLLLATFDYNVPIRKPKN